MTLTIAICCLIILGIILWLMDAMASEEINSHNWKSLEEMEAYRARRRH